MASTREYVLNSIAALFFAGWIFVWLIHVVAIIYGRWRLHRRAPLLTPESGYPGVSIMKPLVGVDDNLFSNLETFFNMNYPVYELLFCIHDECDSSVMPVRQLIEKYPNVDARVFIGGKPVGVNPKINNMTPAYEAAKYDLVMVSDSGLRMKEDTLTEMVNTMTDKVGMVHQMPYKCDRKTGPDSLEKVFAGTLEKVYFGGAHARIYLMADLLRINCTTGMSSVMRKSVLDEAGGLQVFAQYIAEDYFMAKAFLDRKWRVKICGEPAWQNSGNCSISSFQGRLVRWTKLRINMIPILLFFEPMSECVVMGAAASLAMQQLFQWSFLVCFLVHVLIWFLLDYIMLKTVQNGPLPFGKVDFIVAWLVRELSVIPIFAQAASDPTVSWRTGPRVRLRWGGKAEEYYKK